MRALVSRATFRLAVAILREHAGRLAKIENLAGDLDADLRAVENEALPDLSARLEACERRLDALARLHDEIAADIAWVRSADAVTDAA